ncbi:MAG: V-type ATP synthase subunit D [Candidatus Schekmanbacteria bacterium]|nr:V-type ATP synthase subunit D [Candidatus Schekmanbacteria bacterium]
MEQVSPTRMNLLAKKAQIKLAKQGVDLLKKKRDALVKEFFAIVQILLEARKKLEKTAGNAYRSLMIAKGIDGDQALNSAAAAGKRDVKIGIDRKILWGLEIPEVHKEGINFRRELLGRGYSITGVSARVDMAGENFEEILNQLLDIASVEVHLKRLGQEIKKTSRRVNALEQTLVPRLTSQTRFIKNALEERAREDTFRLKHIKKSGSK